MPRGPALTPALRELLNQTAALKKQVRAESAPRRAARRKIAAAVTNAGKALESAKQKLAEWDARPLAHECVALADVSSAHWTAASKATGRIDLQKRVDEWTTELQRREVLLAIFDELHAVPA